MIKLKIFILLFIVIYIINFIGCICSLCNKNYVEHQYQFYSNNESVFIIKVTGVKDTFATLDCLTEQILDECGRKASAVLIRKELLRYNIKKSICDNPNKIHIYGSPNGIIDIIYSIPVSTIDSLIINAYQ
jgi:hypothetical protein